MLWVKFADQKQFNHFLDFNAGAKVILDLTPYSDLHVGFRKTINELLVNTVLTPG